MSFVTAGETRIPKTHLTQRVDDNFDVINTQKMFETGKNVFFTLPGAFTPTCSTRQLPRYEELFEEFQGKGVDNIYCFSVNDGFVMNAWANDLNITKVKMIADGNGAFANKLGILVDKLNLGFGKRAWRCAAVVEDGLITQWYKEPGISQDAGDDPYKVTNPENILSNLE